MSCDILEFDFNVLRGPIGRCAHSREGFICVLETLSVCTSSH